MTSSIFYAIIAILFFNYLFSFFLEKINLKNKPIHLPEIISDIYDKEDYHKQQLYEVEKSKLSIIEMSVSSILIIVLFSLKGFGTLQVIVSNITQNQILQTLIYFGILSFCSLIFSLPFSYYDKFIIEEAYGFNKSTKKLFWIDTLKGVLLTSILGGVILGIISWLYLFNPSIFWITALIVILVFSLLMNALYSTVILPLFNKKTLLSEGELKDKVINFAQNIGFSINNIYLIDGSKRSSKANAFFTGFGRKKRIFLYDTLTNKLTDDEILAVLAHELGHYKKNHIWINLGIGMVQSALFLYLFGIFSQSSTLTEVMGVGGNISIFYLNAICFVLLINPIQTILGILMNFLSRKMEYSADKFASSKGMANSLVSALKKLASINYSNLTPHPFYVLVNYSHPPIYNRIRALMIDSKNVESSNAHE